MINSHKFLKLVLSTMSENIAVIDGDGAIVYTNKSWVEFGDNNNCTVDFNSEEANYLKACDDAAAIGDEFGIKAGEGIRSVINRESENFYFEFPCHSPTEKHWFAMRATPFKHNKNNYYVILHQNITKRKLAEERAIKLSQIDGLTGITNRRAFDKFLAEEWRRCTRLNMPISLAIIDIDHFRILNDTYGYTKGDEALGIISKTLSKYTRRPSDIVARYGGDEFAIIFGNSTMEESLATLAKIQKSISKLKIPNEASPTLPALTVSIGVATLRPKAKESSRELIDIADNKLYFVKNSGRNNIAQ